MEFLILHRAHQGSDFEGEWAWTPPAGARQPGETTEECARRELYEEAGLAAELRRADDGKSDWAIFYAEVAPQTEVVLHDREHDRYEWVSLKEALSRCRPDQVAHGIERAARAIGLV